MATASTSARTRSRFRLRLKDIDDDQAFDFHLYRGRAGSGDLDIVTSTAVHNDHRYAAFLMANEELASNAGLFVINDETEEEVCFAPADDDYAVTGAEGERCYQVLFGADGRDSGARTLFSMVFGLARIRLVVGQGPGSVALETLDIACACDREEYRHLVSGMLDELVDAQDKECIDWMLSPVRLERESISMVEAAKVDDSTKSLGALVDLGRATVRVFRRHLSYFTLHGHCRSSKKEALVGPDSVRRLGRNELLWLARNPDQLYETKCKTAIRRDGKNYMAARIQTERVHRSFDNTENRALLAFAGEIARTFAKAVSDVEAFTERLQQVRASLEQLDVSGDMLPTLVVVDACLRKEEPLLEEARHIQREARNIRESLLKAFPDVVELDYALPKRTKVFQEILPYADMHAEMRKWNAFGRSDVLRDVLAMHTWRIDKLYEYYVLYKMLEQLRSLGFGPDGEEGAAFGQVEYSLEQSDDLYKNEKQVANVYALARGEEKVTLYYQPVFYGDEREEHGIDLHRTTSAWNHPYWTPDYLIVHEDGSGVSRIVVDAKFRPFYGVHWSAASSRVGAGSGGPANPAFLDCMLKYKVGTGGADGVKVDAMWILFGRTDMECLHTYQYSEWAKARFDGLPDGIASVAPGVNRVAGMLAKVGIGEQKPHEGVLPR